MIDGWVNEEMCLDFSGTKLKCQLFSYHDLACISSLKIILSPLSHLAEQDE